MDEENKIEVEFAEEVPLAESPNESLNDDAADSAETADKGKRVRFSDIIAGRILGTKTFTGQLKLAILVLIYSFVLIANRYNIESLTIENKRLQYEIDELRVRQIQNRCDYMNATMFTEVAAKLRPTGIKEGTTPSLKITIKDKR
jgi:hypothetical protein